MQSLFCRWLGHSDFSTTANIYAHLDYRSKLSSAKAMVEGISLPEADHFGSRWDAVVEPDEALFEADTAS